MSGSHFDIYMYDDMHYVEGGKNCVACASLNMLPYIHVHTAYTIGILALSMAAAD